MPEHKVTTRYETFATQRTCSRCGLPGHTTRTCRTATSKAHFKVGIEIEGWWYDLAATKQRQREHGWGRNESDGSLSQHPDPTGETRPWEFQTDAGPLGHQLVQLHGLYPDKQHPAAGLHVHLSFLRWEDVCLLQSRRFVDWALARWQTWADRLEIVGPFRERLAGHNTYTRSLSDADLSRPPGPQYLDRYRWLNFASWGRDNRKTVELRLLPLFRKEALAHAAVVEWITMVEEYLTGWSEPAYVAVLDAFPAPGTEEIVTGEITLGAVPGPDEVEVVTGEAALYAPPVAGPGEVVATAATLAHVFAGATGLDRLATLRSSLRP